MKNNKSSTFIIIVNLIDEAYFIISCIKIDTKVSLQLNCLKEMPLNPIVDLHHSQSNNMLIIIPLLPSPMIAWISSFSSWLLIVHAKYWDPLLSFCTVSGPLPEGFLYTAQRWLVIACISNAPLELKFKHFSC